MVWLTKNLSPMQDRINQGLLKTPAMAVVGEWSESSNAAALECKVRVHQFDSIVTAVRRSYHWLAVFAVAAVDDWFRNWFSDGNLIAVTDSSVKFQYALQTLDRIMHPLQTMLVDAIARDMSMPDLFTYFHYSHATPVELLRVAPLLNPPQQTLVAILSELAEYFFTGKPGYAHRILRHFKMYDIILSHSRVMLTAPWYQHADPTSFECAER